MTTSQPRDPQPLQVLEHDENEAGEFTLWMTTEAGDSVFATFGHDGMWSFVGAFTDEAIIPTHHEAVFAETARIERTK